MQNNLNYSSKGQFTELQNRDLSFRDYYFIIKFHYKKIIFITIVGFAISIYNVMTLVPSYTATATIAVREKPGANLVMDLTGNRDRTACPMKFN